MDISNLHAAVHGNPTTSLQAVAARRTAIALAMGLSLGTAHTAASLDGGVAKQDLVGVFVPDIRLNLQPYLYATKFVCGQQLNPGIQIGQTVRYAALEPGVYSTALNMLTLKQGIPGITVSASMDGYAPVPVATQLSGATAFDTHTVTCDDILQAFNVPPGADAYEGFLYVQRQRPDLRIDAVYTYASRERFQEFRGVDLNGNVVVNPELGVYSIGGAGGLGVGASIALQRVEPVNLNSI